MKPAFTLLGIMTLIVFVGAFIILNKKVEAPVLEEIIVEPMSLTLSSPAFKEGEKIPSKYTCDADNISPELHISEIPEGTGSLILVMDDPDIPESVKQSRGIEKFDHWVLYNIPPESTVIPEGALIGTTGLTSSGATSYVGPCPPDREHRYIFRLYAVSGTLNFIQTPTLDQVEEAARGMMLETATLMGRYERQSVPE